MICVPKSDQGGPGTRGSLSRFFRIPDCATVLQEQAPSAWKFAWTGFPLNMENLGQFLRPPGLHKGATLARWHDDTTTGRSELVAEASGRGVKYRLTGGQIPCGISVRCAPCQRQNPQVAGMVDVAVTVGRHPHTGTTRVNRPQCVLNCSGLMQQTSSLFEDICHVQ
jgi:hypothetical protein